MSYNISKSTPELFAALAKAQASISNPGKTKQNLFFKSRYADLADVLEVVREHFSANGLAILQMPGYGSGSIYVDTVITHETGGLVSFRTDAKPTKTSPKDGTEPVELVDAPSLGRVWALLRRYGALAAAGIQHEDDDDDGQAISYASQNAPKITASQASELHELVKKIGADLPAVTEWLGVTSIESLQSARFASVKSALEKRLKAAGSTNGGADDKQN